MAVNRTTRASQGRAFFNGLSRGRRQKSWLTDLLRTATREMKTDLSFVTEDKSMPNEPQWTLLAIASAHWRNETNSIPVPSSWQEAHSVFWTHPTSISALCVLLGLHFLAWRTESYLNIFSLAMVFLGASAWIVQEWFIHAKLFHGNLEWLGSRIHMDHHKERFHHIAIDGVEITLPFMLVTSLVFVLGMGSVSAAIGYISMGLTYEFAHFAVHTKAIPKSKLARSVRLNHMLHHCRSEEFWFSFTAPIFDSWMGTKPEPSSVQMTELARRAVSKKEE